MSLCETWDFSWSKWKPSRTLARCPSAFLVNKFGIRDEIEAAVFGTYRASNLHMKQGERRPPPSVYLIWFIPLNCPTAATAASILYSEKATDGSALIWLIGTRRAVYCFCVCFWRSKSVSSVTGNTSHREMSVFAKQIASYNTEEKTKMFSI